MAPALAVPVCHGSLAWSWKLDHLRISSVSRRVENIPSSVESEIDPDSNISIFHPIDGFWTMTTTKKA
jgi:hypothetical protein